jgi:hypothetical protein
MKIPLTPAGIETGTFRFVAQELNHCATAVPIYIYITSSYVQPEEGPKKTKNTADSRKYTKYITKSRVRIHVIFLFDKCLLLCHFVLHWIMRR